MESSALPAGQEYLAFPVLIVYFSAVVEEDGQVYFLEDIYSHDKELAKPESQAYASNN